MKLVWRHQNHCHKDGIWLGLRPPPMFAYEGQNAYEGQIAAASLALPFWFASAQILAHFGLIPGSILSSF